MLKTSLSSQDIIASAVLPVGVSLKTAANALADGATSACAKPVIASAIQAVDSAQNGSTLTIFLDSYAADLGLSDQLLTEAVDKGIKVFIQILKCIKIVKHLL